MTSQTGQKITIIYILANISRSKVDQAMNVDQLIEYNVRKAFTS